MAVQIPTINRIQPSSAMPKNDRLNMKVQDQGSEIMQRSQQISSVVNQGLDIQYKEENDKIDQLSFEVENEYSAWNNEQLQKLKSHEGDPTDAYVEYDKLAKEKYDDILSKRPDLNDRVRGHVTARFDKTVAQQNIGVLKQRGMQIEVYDNNLYESSVKLKKNNLPVVAGYVSKDDPSSFMMFDQGLADIKTTVAKQALKKGSAVRLPDDAKSGWNHTYQDDDGNIVKVQMSDLAKVRAAKELSEGVKSSIDVMIAGGQVEEAKLMQEKYKGYLDPASAAKLNNKMRTTGRKDEAYSVIASLKGKSADAQIEAINKIPDPELRTEALKIKDADDRRIEAMMTRKSKANYNTLADSVLKKMNSDQPFYGVADLENDPLYKQTWDNIDAKQKKAILEMVDAPKESNDKSLLGVQDLFLGKDTGLETMTPQDFAEKTVGLSKADKTKYTNLFMSLRTQTEGERRSMYTSAGKMLQDQLLVDGHISRNAYNKIAGDDEIALIEAKNTLIDHLSTQPGSFNEKQLKDFVKDYSASVIKGKAFNPKPRTTLSDNVSTKSAAPSVTLPTGDALIALKREYRTKYNKFPTKSEVEEYLRNKK